jgi:hypothetical protein
MGDPAVSGETVGSAIERPSRVVITNFRIKSGDIFGLYVGRV